MMDDGEGGGGGGGGGSSREMRHLSSFGRGERFFFQTMVFFSRRFFHSCVPFFLIYTRYKFPLGQFEAIVEK